MVRTRTIGNFLWHIYASAMPYQQAKFKQELLDLSSGNEDKMWQSFMRVQTAPDKQSGFSAEIVGVMVQVFCEDSIKVMFSLTDLQKLQKKYNELQLQKKQKTVWN
jgi:hypothetical protein